MGTHRSSMSTASSSNPGEWSPPACSAHRSPAHSRTPRRATASGHPSALAARGERASVWRDKPLEVQGAGRVGAGERQSDAAICTGGGELLHSALRPWRATGQGTLFKKPCGVSSWPTFYTWTCHSWDKRDTRIGFVQQHLECESERSGAFY